MMDVILHPGAVRDARGIASQYSAVSEALAARFWREVDGCLEAIGNRPERYHFDPSGFRRLNMSGFPYHILFEVRADSVRIMVVRHDHRAPEYGLRRR